MAATMRSVLSDIFREAIVEGHIENNPVTPTRAAKVVVKRERLELAQYGPIRGAADTMPPWFGLAMDLALVSGQRREDLTQMRFSHVVDGRLLVEQGKTGAMISLPLDLELKILGLRLGTVIDRCRMVSTTDFMISAGIRKNSPDGSLHPDGLTKKICCGAEGFRFVVRGKSADISRDQKFGRPAVREGKRKGFCAETAGAYIRDDDSEISQYEGERVRNAVKDRISKFE